MIKKKFWLKSRGNIPFITLRKGEKRRLVRVDSFVPLGLLEQRKPPGVAPDENLLDQCERLGRESQNSLPLALGGLGKAKFNVFIGDDG